MGTRLLALPVLVAVGTACATAGTTGESGNVEAGDSAAARVSQVAADSLVPPGYGTLRQDDVTLSLRSEALLIKATPLAESVVRLLAPDTYNRLAGLARSHLEAAARQALVRDPLLVFVSFFSYQPNVTFQPEDLHIRSHSIRYRPLAILPMTPGWGAQRLAQQETQMAVYAYDSRVDLRAPFVVEYRQAQSLDWQQIIPKLDEERAKVRARAAPRRDSDPSTDYTVSRGGRGGISGYVETRSNSRYFEAVLRVAQRLRVRPCEPFTK